jgi:TonB-dependent receptor
MYKTQSFKKKMLVTAVASAAMAGFALPAFAQDEADTEIVVTGIRASLDRAMDVKRNSSGVVDAINAEDMGKFPDSNLAESLQRISGVSIDRRNGEGTQITVRGFGPSFNLITLNGRNMPASQIGARGGINSSRSFDMSNIASEGISAVEVYKTGKAHVQSGGIGATVNLKTLRPMDHEGFKASIGAKALADTTVQVGRDVTPELSGIVSWSNDIVGLSLTASHQERDSAQAGVFTNNWADYSGTYANQAFLGNGTPTSGPHPAIVSGVQVGQQANHTPGIRYHYGDYERTRDNIQAVVQFRPVENLTATLDYTEANQEEFVNSSEMSFWFGGGAFPISNAVFDGNTKAATPIYLWAENKDVSEFLDDGVTPNPRYQMANGNVRDIGITQNQGAVQNNLESVGFNVEFQATDNLSFEFDAHNSESESLPADGAVGNYFNIALGIQGVYGQGYINTGGLPLLVGAYSDRYLNDHDGDANTPMEYGIRDGGWSPGFYDKADLGSTVRQINYDRVWSSVDEYKLSGQFELENGKIDFGVQSTELESTQKSSFDQIVLEGNWGVGTPGDVPPYMMRELNYGQLFSKYRTTMTAEEREWFDNAGTEDPTRPGSETTGRYGEVMLRGFIANDVAELGKLLSRNANLAWAPNPSDGTNRTINEEVTAFYVQGQMNWDLGGMPLDVTAGVRYEETEATSMAQVGQTSFVWQGDNDFVRNVGEASLAPVTTKSDTYDNVLPSLDVSLGFTEDMKGRFSYSTTIARANYDLLQEGMTGVQPPRGGPTLVGGQPGDASSGNVGLLPIESDNFDLSFEWYYDDASYVSVGYFLKQVPNFIGSKPTIETVVGVLDQSNGPRAQAAQAALIAQNIPVNQQTLFAMVAAMSPANGPGCANNPSAPGGARKCGDAFGWTGNLGTWNTGVYEGTNGWENGVDILSVAGDPNSVNRVTRPVNSQDADLDGWEFAAQHFFGDTGFGLQANYTMVNGDISYDITGSPTTTQFALAGLSDSANLTLIYENFGWSARLAYNWRDAFLESPTGGGANEPGFAEEYSQVDFSVSYEVTDNFTLGLEGLNVLEEDTRQYARTERQLRRLEILGARYALSARYTF